MNSFKNIFKLYKLDWKRIFKNKVAVFFTVALCILPSLYAWFNIVALWDPYGNTKSIPVAVYSDDIGAEFDGKNIEVGDELLDNLRENKNLGWTFVNSKQDLVDGVESGKYYAGIYVPTDFSEDLISFTSGEIKKPDLEYYVNEKINAIAPRITDKGASTIQEQISQNFIKISGDTLLGIFNDIGFNIDSNLVDLTRVKTLILETDKNSDSIEGYLNEVIALNDKMPELKDKLSKINELSSHTSDVDKLAEKVHTLNDKMPKIKENAAIILDVQKDIPEIKDAARQLDMIDKDFYKIESIVNTSIADGKKGVQILNRVNSTIPKVEALRDSANTVGNDVNNVANKLVNLIPDVTRTVDILLNIGIDSSDLVISSVNNANAFVDRISDPQTLDNISYILSDVTKKVELQHNVTTSLLELITRIHDSLPTRLLEKHMDKLQHISSIEEDLLSLLNTAQANKFDSGILKDTLYKIADGANSIKQLNLALLNSNLPNDLALTLNDSMSTITSTQELLNQINFGEISDLLSSLSDTLSQTLDLLEKYQEELPKIGNEIHEANSLLNNNLDNIIESINEGARLYKEELPKIEEGVSKADNFLQNDWPTIKDNSKHALDVANDKFPELEKALTFSVDMIHNDWPHLKQGIHKAADAIEKGEKEFNISEIIKLLKLDAEKQSDFLSKPVNLKTHSMFPIPNNGSAVTPFYTALCLWVGALLLSSVAITDYYVSDEEKSLYTKRQTITARYFTFLTIGLIQALIVCLGNIYLLGVTIVNKPAFILFALLISFCFISIIYTLCALFNNVGKGIAVIILVLSISGGGGNYPVQVSGVFFQKINPMLPFTHAVNILREAVGGIYFSTALNGSIFLIIIAVVSLLLGLTLYPIIGPPIHKFLNSAKSSHFYH